MKHQSIVMWFFLGILIIWVYQSWFFSPVNLSMDLSLINYDELFNQYKNQPTVWYNHINNGFGQYALYPLLYYWYFFSLFNIFSFVSDPFILHKITFLFPILIAGIISCKFFVDTFLRSNSAKFTFCLIFLFNPYIIMAASGGQAGIATAYMLTPLIIAQFYLLFLSFIDDNLSLYNKLRNTILFTASVIAQSMFDSRISYITMFALVLMGLGFICYKKKQSKIVKEAILYGAIFFLIFIGFHATWIISSIFNKSIQIPQGYDSIESLRFLSFARLAHGMTLMHPNYPDNIFGEVREVTGILYIIPILAFVQLRKKTPRIVYFSLLALLGIFCIKGANEPLGGIYAWAYTNVPFMNLYRDATKFFVLIAVGFSYLIALSVQEVWSKSKNILLKYTSVTIVIICFVIGWLPTWSNTIQGTFKYRVIPENYRQLQDKLLKDTNFGRVLWIPAKENYGYSSINHPAVNLTELIRTPTCLPELCIKEKNWPENFVISKQNRIDEITETSKLLNHAFSSKILQDLAIKYIVITSDEDQNIYRHDRQFAPFLREEYKSQIDRLGALTKISDQEHLTVYTTQYQTALIIGRDVYGNNTTIQSSSSHPTEYRFQVDTTLSQLIFSQSYDKSWVLVDQRNNIVTLPKNINGINTYSGQINPGTYTLIYQGNRYAVVGYKISLVTIGITLMTLLIVQIKISKKNI